MYVIALPWLMSQPAAACEAVSMMAPLEPTAVGWDHAERASDGDIAPVGEATATTMSARAAENGAELVWRFDTPRNLKALVLEIEADDRVELFALTPGESWGSLGVVGPRSGKGLDIHEGQFNLTTSGLKLVGISGAPFAVGEIAAYDCVDNWPARDLHIRAGRPELPFLHTWQYLGFGHAWVALWAVGAMAFGRLGRWRTAGVSAGLLVAGASWPLVGVTAALIGAILVGLAVVRTRAAATVAGAVVLCAALAWINLGGFRQVGTPVHYHEFFHYYLGSRYAEPLGYGRLYACTLAAEAELYPANSAQIASRMVRRVEDGLLVPGATLLQHAQECRDRFGPSWADFRQEVSVFHAIFSAESWQNILLDHEYNASPSWSLAGGLLAQGPPITRAQDLYPLVWIDPLLGALLLAGLVWVWGWEAAAWAALVWALGWPWRYGYIGGSFARLEWPALMVGAVVLAARGWFVWAGALIGVAASVRVFPGLALAGPALVWIVQPVRRPAVQRMLIGAAVGVAAAVGVSAAALSADLWLDFLSNLLHHSAADSNNRMGLENLVPDNTPMGLARGVVGGLVLVWLYREARQATSLGTIVLQGLLLPILTLNLSSYYWLGLALLGPLWAAQSRRATMLVLALSAHEVLINLLPMGRQLPYGIAYALFAPLAVWAASSTHPPLRDKDAPVSGHALSAPRGSPS